MNYLTKQDRKDYRCWVRPNSKSSHQHRNFFWGYTEENTEAIAPAEEEDQSGQSTYRKNSKNEILSVTLTTVNQAENVTAAKLIQTFWETISIKVNCN